MATQYVLCNNIDLSFSIRPLGIGTEYATHVYLPEVAGIFAQFAAPLPLAEG